MARPRTHTAELREQIMGCALDAVAEHGVKALVLRDIADCAGTSTTAVYSLFGNKEELHRSVLIRAFTDFATAQESEPPSDSPVDDIAGLGMRYVQWALDHPRLYEAMFTDSAAGLAPSSELDEARARAIAAVSDAVGRALETGAFRPADQATIVVSLWAQVHGLAVLMIAGQLPDEADIATAAWAVVAGWLSEENPS
ncbi:putative TetR family transcriptional regulator [Gordonia araii NBRC 100433]|uniref:Putative TetR family transcriptional regulator n=1 Tax=Gordonia araii NBRC 100433 TaxID=1073574 RepID=G7H2G9_9ACTN|nr:WHG domain-containing protein [Gordonia araii]NNG97582.1 TetR/AcrR family transcriptional regulator [Gordonia araii NBRC 100433]GAB10044.1 putative TetR family transcriptional regulator [Gordonia araii NBRC 100433]